MLNLIFKSVTRFFTFLVFPNESSPYIIRLLVCNQLGCPSWPVPPLLFTETRVRVQAGGILPPSSQKETNSARDGVFTAR
ncbi:hypothetical protein Hanom_Chr06g00513871 [Helianthus anomalus]